jgi:hypothetical protein
MSRILSALILTLGIAGLATMSATSASAAEGEARSKSGWPKPTRAVKPGEKVCKHKFSNGERTVWICEKAQPCCEWEALNYYVKCGSTVTGCL